ncbi:MAG: hypothetical protein MUF55_01540 [Hydrogenophaga sp.]|nr:hypothetical protein [Hydrogenophaga sp.]
MASDAARPPALRWRGALLAPGAIALVLGLAAGLWRLGAWGALPSGNLLLRAGIGHGALMVCGFFGLVISLERAVACAGWRRLRRAPQRPRSAGLTRIGDVLPFLAPLLAALGTLLWMAGEPAGAAVAWWGSALGLLLMSLWLWRAQAEPFLGVLALGAAASLWGQTLWWAGAPIAAIVPCWLAFLIFTIAGERLELSRMVPRPPGAERVLLALLVLLGAVVLWASLAATLGTGDATGDSLPHRLLGAGFVGLGLWLLRHDLARRTVRRSGLVRFVAVCLLAGYGWLVGSGALMAAVGLTPGSAAWDVALHALTLGFVFSMVFGHAPLILPAVMRVPVPFTRAFYAPLVLLHASVALRTLGTLGAVPSLRRVAAWASVLAILAFIALIVRQVRSASKGPRRPALPASIAGVRPGAPPTPSTSSPGATP